MFISYYKGIKFHYMIDKDYRFFIANKSINKHMIKKEQKTIKTK